MVNSKVINNLQKGKFYCSVQFQFTFSHPIVEGNQVRNSSRNLDRKPSRKIADWFPGSCSAAFLVHSMVLLVVDWALATSIINQDHYRWDHRPIWSRQVIFCVPSSKMTVGYVKLTTKINQNKGQIKTRLPWANFKGMLVFLAALLEEGRHWQSCQHKTIYSHIFWENLNIRKWQFLCLF